MLTGVKTGKVLGKDTQDKEETVGGIGDDNIRENSVGMLTTIAENPKDAKAGLFLSARNEINNGTAVIVMDMAVAGASTDRAGFEMWLKKSQVGIKNRF